jgi:hypothetical protein
MPATKSSSAELIAVLPLPMRPSTSPAFVSHRYCILAHEAFGYAVTDPLALSCDVATFVRVSEQIEEASGGARRRAVGAADIWVMWHAQLDLQLGWRMKVSQNIEFED